MFRFLTAAMVMVALTGCLPVPQETQAALDSVEAMGKPPVVTQEQRQTQYVNCEVKNNKGGPCLIEDQGNLDNPGAAAAYERALAVPFPAECRALDITPDYERGYTGDEAQDIRIQVLNATSACSDWLDAVSKYAADPGNPKDPLGKRYAQMRDIVSHDMNVMDGVEKAWQAAEARRRAAAAAPVLRPSGGDMCANPYGGAAAQGGQYICSNQGELLACQCSGGSCDLISTQSFLCTQAGAVIR